MRRPAERPVLGLYVHIPFCKAKCAYCDFYSLAHSEEKMDAYTAALVRHLEEAPRRRYAGGHGVFRRRHPQLSGRVPTDTPFADGAAEV